MAEIASNEGGGKKKKGGSKQKKFSVHVDFTPMVDMNMLLITFFMLCTSLSKPQTMEISMPSNKDIPQKDQPAVAESKAITLLLSGKNKVYYYAGLPNFSDPAALKQTSYEAEGIRKFLLSRNVEAVAKINELKQQKLDKLISQEQFAKQSSELRSGKNTPVVIIKATDEATYENLIDALDEMQICSIGKYVIDKITDREKAWLKLRESGVAAVSQVVPN
jgi:biopolymer transport protein ExbD